MRKVGLKIAFRQFCHGLQKPGGDDDSDNGGSLKKIVLLGRDRMSSILKPGRYAPFSPTRTPASTRDRTLSSAKNGFPSVRRITSSLSGARSPLRPNRCCKSSSTLVGCSGSTRSCV